MSNSIAVIANRENLDSQALLSEAVTAWRKAGIKVAGVLAENINVEGMCSAGFMRDIASEKKFSVQLDAPAAGTTCHLDATGMESAGTNLLAQIPGADIVVFSKFGKLEAAQGGLWAAFQAAIASGKPILTTVSSRHIESWKKFAPEAVWLEGDHAAIEQWRSTVS